MTHSFFDFESKKCLSKTLTLQSQSNEKLSDDLKKNKDILKEFMADDADGMLDARIKYIKDEIEIRVQSLHNELDEMQNKIFGKIDELKRVSKNQLKQFFKSSLIEELVKSSEILYENIINGESFEIPKIKHNIENLEKINKEIRNKISKVSFETANESLNIDIIGKIESDDLLLGEQVHYRPYKKIDLNFLKNKPTAMCAFNDKFLLATYKKENKIVKLNSDYQIIEEISVIDSMKLNKPSIICTDECEHVYLLNENNSQIIIMDISLRQVIRVLKYTHYDFESIVSLVYCNKKLYILDTNTLHVFKHDGEFLKKVNLNVDYASHMVVNEDCIIIVDNSNKIQVYNHDGSFRSEIKTNNIGLINSISLINSYLFVHSSDGNFFSFNQNEKNDFELVFCRCLYDLRETSSSMFYFNQHIFILLPFERSLVVF